MQFAQRLQLRDINHGIIERCLSMSVCMFLASIGKNNNS